MQRSILALLLAAPALATADSTFALTDAELAQIVNSVVPDYNFRVQPSHCPPGVDVIDRRGQVTVTSETAKVGVSVPKPPVCAIGLDVRAGWSDSLTWETIKNSGRGDDFVRQTTGAGLSAVKGAYLYGGADALAPPKSPSTSRQMKLLYEHILARYVRDDGLENDACLDYTIRDSLFDGAWTNISVRPGQGNQDEMSKYDALGIIERSLFHSSCQPDPRDRGDRVCPRDWSAFQPFKWSSCGGSVQMRDVIIRVDDIGQGNGDFPPGSYNNVHFIWPNDFAYKGTVPASVTLHTGQDGLRLWNAAREKWLAQHGCKPHDHGCTMTMIADSSSSQPPAPERAPVIGGLPALLFGQ